MKKIQFTIVVDEEDADAIRKAHDGTIGSMLSGCLAGILKKSVVKEESIQKYIFRNYPCSIGGREMPFHVGGECDGRGAGVLEWCFDEEDARNVKREMEKDPRFSNLKIYETK